MGFKLEWTSNQSGIVKALERFLEILWGCKLEWFLNQSDCQIRDIQCCDLSDTF